MKTIYLVDEYASSQNNGIGAFVREFVYCMRRMHLPVCHIAFNAPVKEFARVEEKGVGKMLFPVFPKGTFIHYPAIVDKFFRLYIPDSPETLFFFNHSPCDRVLEAVRRSHPQSKLIFTTHDFGWTHYLAGNRGAFDRLVRNRAKKKIQERKGYLLNYFDREKKTHALADKLVCLSEDTYRFLLDTYGVDPGKLLCIPNGMRRKTGPVAPDEKAAVRKRLAVGPEEKILLFVGRPTLQKGFFALIRAFAGVVKIHPEARLVVAGSDGSVRVENLLVKIPQCATRITFTGLLDKKALYNWYRAADIGLFPSYYEQSSYTGIEMLMYGLPVVATDGYGVNNMFRSGENARIAGLGGMKSDKRFVVNLEEAMNELLASGDACRKLAEGARKAYGARYHIRHMLRSYRRLIESI